MAGENETKVTLENKPEETVTETQEVTEKETTISQEEFISEFAPEPIKIPNYDKEKEMRKLEKANKKAKKRRSKKSKKRRKLLRKIAFITRSVLLFILLLAVIIMTVSSLFIKMSTSEYSIKSVIRSSEPETFVIGKIKSPAKINLKPSSQRASVADVLRDNSLITVSYADIKYAVTKSTYPDFVADIAYDVVNYFVYGTDFEELTSNSISQAVLDNVSYIKLITGVELGESACADIGSYVAKSKTIKGLWKENLAKQPAAQYTHVTSVLFSTTFLICSVIALMLLMVLILLLCKGFAHKMIGWAIVVAGLITGAVGFFVKPMFTPQGDFVKSVLDVLVKNFNKNAVIYGVITILIGVLVILIGKAMDDEDDEDEDEYDYIDEIEQHETV